MTAPKTSPTESLGSVTVLAAVGSAGPVGSVGSLGRVLDEVRAWFARFVCVMDDRDLDLLTLWAAHTHLCFETYSTPRLVLDSPMHGSGKTTVLEHLSRLCLSPIQAASLSSPALLTRMLNAGMRTILIDEVDRSLDPKKPGVEDLIAVLNSGYKRGATRPVLVPVKGGNWEVAEMSTFSPVAMAGNSPALPDDTRSRCITVLLLPDLEGVVESSDWEEIEEDAKALGARLAAAAETVRELVRTARPSIPEGTVGRIKERWYPIKRVASAASEKWAGIADDLIIRDIAATALDREDGINNVPPAVALLRDVYAAWPDSLQFIPTVELVERLIHHNPQMWSSESTFGKDLTVQRFGRMMVTKFKLHSERQGDSARGYHRSTIAPTWRRMGVTPLIRTDGADGAAKTDGETCRVCAAPLLAPASKTAGICGKRDNEHKAGRLAA
ncbi:DUF3631 domain-containing protein [Cryobacterium sp. TMS1-20-1]|uniref:DUF3631 domain-containing protein n=1 Tax=Cryobacterium sp. TMS1-20-1 TaxID=1259223 RepID=UPI00106B1E1D|nr:DUF3631 domain-containing protein [Cryobacterium sp. TMS1-20-1]TFC71405.1 DUF3631 domain-containing protein [Cryobacterium sp. TMS1-20-1]